MNLGHQPDRLGLGLRPPGPGGFGGDPLMEALPTQTNPGPATPLARGRGDRGVRACRCRRRPWVSRPDRGGVAGAAGQHGRRGGVVRVAAPGRSAWTTQREDGERAGKPRRAFPVQRCRGRRRRRLARRRPAAQRHTRRQASREAIGKIANRFRQDGTSRRKNGPIRSNSPPLQILRSPDWRMFLALAGRGGRGGAARSAPAAPRRVAAGPRVGLRNRAEGKPAGRQRSTRGGRPEGSWPATEAGTHRGAGAAIPRLVCFSAPSARRDPPTSGGRRS